MARRATTSALALAAGLLLAGCGAGDPAASGGAGTAAEPGSTRSPEATGAPGTSGSTTPHVEADVAFLTGMHPHHAQAVEMAALVDGRTQDPAVTALAEQIAQAQQPEMDRMATLLAAFGEPAPSGDMDHGPMDDGPMDHEGEDHGATDHGGTEGMPGMMSAQDMTALEGASGADFDRRFLEMMVEHHEGAVVMSQTQLAEGENPDARALAEDIIAVQEQEVAQMRELLAQD